jgi:hypothetical protein
LRSTVGLLISERLFNICPQGTPKRNGAVP